jgi:hypothetical protein
MKIKQTLTTLAIIMGVFTGAVAYSPVTLAQSTNAADYQDAKTPTGNGGMNPSTNATDNNDAQSGGKGGTTCGGANGAILSCSQKDGATTKDNGVWALLVMALQILTAAVGIVAVGGIAYGAALYASSGDKPDQAKQGMEYIRNVIIGLVAYGLMFILLNFLIPGGIIG